MPLDGHIDGNPSAQTLPRSSGIYSAAALLLAG